MVFPELESLALGIALGLGVFALLSRVVFKADRSMKKEVSIERKGEHGRILSRLEVDKANRELKALLLEKEILSHALTTLYEAEAEGKISKEERESLASKYKEQLRNIEDKLSDVELIIQVGELEGLREQIINLFEQKLSKIERKLEETRLKLGKLPQLKLEVEKVEEIKEKPQEEKPIAKVSREKKPSTKTLTDEIYEALARLERIDIER
ncbi:MAG: hypothetical protein QXX95_05535 [Nitrososphaerales archaeon]